MRINLHSLFLASAVLAAGAFTSQPALAAGTAAVHIPFNFVASGRVLPAGDYILHEGMNTSIVSLQGAKNSLQWTVGPGSPNPTDERVILTFDRVGERHLLRSVQYGPMITSRLDKQRKERVSESEQIAAVE